MKKKDEVFVLLSGVEEWSFGLTVQAKAKLRCG